MGNKNVRATGMVLTGGIRAVASSTSHRPGDLHTHAPPFGRCPSTHPIRTLSVVDSPNSRAISDGATGRESNANGRR